MNNLRTLAVGVACVVGLGTGMASADTGKHNRASMPHHHGHMAMMGHGHGGMMGHGHGGMMGHGHGGMMGHGYGGMMGHGHGGMMGHGHGGMMGHGPGAMMGPGRGWMHGAAGMHPDRLGDAQLDRIGEHIAQHHQAMQEIAAEQDPAARRELVREHLKSRQGRRGHRYSGDDEDPDAGHGGHRRGGMGPGSGMAAPGMMGPGAGMMGRGSMGPGMTAPEQLSDEQLDRMAEHMAESFERMQRLADTTDQDERRELLREHFQSMQKTRGGMY